MRTPADLNIVPAGLDATLTLVRNRDTILELSGGRKWRQAEYKYHYHYAYMPRAKIIQEGGRYVLHVEGMGDVVELRPV